MNRSFLMVAMLLVGPRATAADEPAPAPRPVPLVAPTPITLVDPNFAYLSCTEGANPCSTDTLCRSCSVKLFGRNQKNCINTNYPLSDWLYIRRFCQPTLIPGSCYGHFPTKWRRWSDHCPNWDQGCAQPGNVTVLQQPALPQQIVPLAPNDLPMMPIPETPKIMPGVEKEPKKPFPLPELPGEKDKVKSLLPIENNNHDEPTLSSEPKLLLLPSPTKPLVTPPAVKVPVLKDH